MAVIKHNTKSMHVIPNHDPAAFLAPNNEIVIFIPGKATKVYYKV